MPDIDDLPLFSAATRREAVTPSVPPNDTRARASATPQSRRMKQIVESDKVAILVPPHRPPGPLPAKSEVVFLPISRRRDIVRKFSRRMVEQGFDKRAMKNVRFNLEQMAAKRINLGVPEEIAIADLETLERAIHVAARLINLSHGGDAA